MKASQISLSGLEVEWRRLEVIANNIANANTSRTATGEIYQPMRLISGPKGGFSKLLGDGVSDSAPTGVTVYGVEPTGAPPRRVYDPTNPQADKDGYVTYPGLDSAEEMISLIKTSRSYEANLAAMSAAHQMYAKALDIGKRS